MTYSAIQSFFTKFNILCFSFHFLANNEGAYTTHQYPVEQAKGIECLLKKYGGIFF